MRTTRKRFGWLGAYVDSLEKIHQRGHATDEQAALLTEYAEILIAELDT